VGGDGDDDDDFKLAEWKYVRLYGRKAAEECKVGRAFRKSVRSDSKEVSKKTSWFCLYPTSRWLSFNML
jgi:hypothetical protein